MDVEFLKTYNKKSEYYICVLGSKESGKTSLILRYLNNGYQNKYFPTKKINSFGTCHNFCKENEEDRFSSIQIIDK